MLYNTGLIQKECKICGEEFDHVDDIEFLEKNGHCGCDDERLAELAEIHFHRDEYLNL